MAPQPWSFDDERFLMRNLGPTCVILHIESGEYYTLEGSGKRIYDLLRDQKTEKEIRRILARDYGIEDERAAGDLRGFLDHLRSKGILRQVGA
jgi:PqqD family protein of HPr-rel-A system